MKTVILAGGLGTRLLPYTTFLPKPMLPLGEKPLLEHLVEWSRKNGIESVILCVSYLRRAIEDYFGDGSDFGVNIEYAVSKRPLATAGQLKTAEPLIDGTFVCMYGDSIFDFDLKSMIRLHRRTRAEITLGISRYSTTLPYGVIARSGNRVKSWDEKPEVSADINMGCYVMEPGVFAYIPKNRSYGMDSVVRKAMAKKRRVSAYLSPNEFVDIGDPESYEKANKKFISKLGRV